MLDPAREHLSIGRLFSRTAEVLQRGGWRLLGLAVAVFVVTQLIDDALSRLLAAQIAAHQPLYLLPWLAQFGPFVIGDTAVVCLALRVLSGETLSLRGSLAAALRLLPVTLLVDLVENVPAMAQRVIPEGAVASPIARLMGVTVASPAFVPMALALWLGAIAVGAIWESFWAPSMAVAVAEGGRADRALGRGLALTKANRAAVIVFNLTLDLGSAIVPMLLAPVIGVEAAVMLAAPFFAWGSAGQAVIYRELVRLKEGVGPAEVAGVFD
jgi:hypothetical protein